MTQYFSDQGELQLRALQSNFASRPINLITIKVRQRSVQKSSKIFNPNVYLII